MYEKILHVFDEDGDSHSNTRKDPLVTLSEKTR